MNRNTSRSPAGTPPAFPVELSRIEIEDTIERLIALLDDLDPDADLEPSEDTEPSLGSLAVRLASGLIVDDCEAA